MTITSGSLLLCKRWGRQHVGRGSTAQKKRRNRHQANPSFYFVFPFRFSAQRLFIRSDSFLRPAAVRRFPPFCFLPELCFAPTEAAWLGSPAFFISAYLRFIASEIFLLAAALILFFLGAVVGLTVPTLFAIAGKGLS